MIRGEFLLKTVKSTLPNDLKEHTSSKTRNILSSVITLTYQPESNSCETIFHFFTFFNLDGVVDQKYFCFESTQLNTRALLNNRLVSIFYKDFFPYLLLTSMKR